LSRKFLLDTNVLIALTEAGHTHHQKAQDWFNSCGNNLWGICPLVEAGFIRITMNPKSYPNPRTIDQAIAILQAMKGLDRFWYWEMRESWVNLTAPFAAKVFGHRQVTDAYLLGLAIKENGVLVTFDRGIVDMAGDKFQRNVLLLAPRLAA